MARCAAQTEVSSDRSRSEIERTLRRYGATAFAYGWEGNRAQVGFKLADRQIRFQLPLPDPDSREFRLTPAGRDRSAKAAEGGAHSWRKPSMKAPVGAFHRQQAGSRNHHDDGASCAHLTATLTATADVVRVYLH